MLVLDSVLPKVFAVYAGFWVFVLIALFVAVGFLLRKQERMRHGGGNHH